MRPGRSTDEARVLMIGTRRMWRKSLRCKVMGDRHIEFVSSASAVDRGLSLSRARRFPVQTGNEVVSL